MQVYKSINQFAESTGTSWARAKRLLKKGQLLPIYCNMSDTKSRTFYALRDDMVEYAGLTLHQIKIQNEQEKEELWD